MARFEGALARVSARAGVIPPGPAKVIEEVCARASFDVATLTREARLAGTLAIPFVKALMLQVATASKDATAYVHYGATSQDVMDTAATLCLKPAGQRIAALALELGDATAALAQRHAATPTVARTLLQPATPVPFGWKAAMWLAPLARSYPHFCHAARESSVLQFGGAAGTLSAFGEHGMRIASELATELGLGAAVTWHSARDPFARLGSESAILIGVSAKIARDIALLMQPEVGEASEPALAGRGGSSSMPHKRNPAGCLLALEAASRAPALAAVLLGELTPEHERGIGQWQGQWFTARELACATASALAAMAQIVRGLEVDPAAMRANLDRSRGLVFSEAVALRLSRPVADRLCEQAVREKRPLIDVLRADPQARSALGESELERLFDAQASFGAATAMMQRVLDDWATARESAP